MPGVDVRLRARHLPVHRLPALRLRLRGGEQPVARPAGALDHGAPDGQGHGRRLRPRRRLLPAGAGARGGPLLRPGGVPAVPQRAVHEGVPDRRDLDRARRHRRHRLRLVHRVPLLHGGLPVRRPALQLGRTVDPEGRASTRTRTSSATARAQRASSRSAPSASSGRGTAATRPASKSARSARGSSATCSTPTARSATSSSTSGCWF